MLTFRIQHEIPNDILRVYVTTKLKLLVLT